VTTGQKGGLSIVPAKHRRAQILSTPAHIVEAARTCAAFVRPAFVRPAFVRPAFALGGEWKVATPVKKITIAATAVTALITPI
jgi:hypothetical protein